MEGQTEGGEEQEEKSFTQFLMLAMAVNELESPK